MENISKTEINNKRNFIKEFIVNDSETKIRVGFKEIEERVQDETKTRKINAPLTVEEKSYLSLN
jgi:hypothetical protein